MTRVMERLCALVPKGQRLNAILLLLSVLAASQTLVKYKTLSPIDCMNLGICIIVTVGFSGLLVMGMAATVACAPAMKHGRQTQSPDMCAPGSGTLVLSVVTDNKGEIVSVMPLFASKDGGMEQLPVDGHKTLEEPRDLKPGDSVILDYCGRIIKFMFGGIAKATIYGEGVPAPSGP